MDWSEQISRFQMLDADNVPLFASPGEMDQAVNTYNKAIANLNNDSQDIALIALRKLAATYPLFPQPAFLLGCCLARIGNRTEAIEWIDQAILGGLPEDLHHAARNCQAFLKTRPVIQNQDKLAAAPKPVTQNPLNKVRASAVLEKTHRRARVRMASDKERRDVLRHSEFPEKEETHVRMPRDPATLLRLILPILAGVLIVATLVIAAVFWLPETRLFRREDEPASARLDWLLERLDQLAGEQAAVASLLADYRDRFEPAPTPEPADQSSAPQTEQTERLTTTTADQTTQPTVTEKPVPTLTPTPTPQPTPDPDKATLAEAAADYAEAVDRVPDDLAQAALHLVNARTLLATLPEETTASGVTGDAASLSTQVEDLIADIAFSAARELRLLAEPLFKNGQYTEALAYYLPAFEVYPRSYNGGVAYYVGRCYQLLGDFATAKPYFEYVIDQFAGRDIADSAAFRLQEMGY